jgi:hypothetical protein
LKIIIRFSWTFGAHKSTFYRHLSLTLSSWEEKLLKYGYKMRSFNIFFFLFFKWEKMPIFYSFRQFIILLARHTLIRTLIRIFIDLLFNKFHQFFFSLSRTYMYIHTTFFFCSIPPWSLFVCLLFYRIYIIRSCIICFSFISSSISHTCFLFCHTLPSSLCTFTRSHVMVLTSPRQSVKRLREWEMEISICRFFSSSVFALKNKVI